MNFAQKCYSPAEVVHVSSKNAIKHFNAIPFKSVLVTVEIDHNKNLIEHLFSACSSQQDLFL